MYGIQGGTASARADLNKIIKYSDTSLVSIIWIQSRFDL